MSSPITPADRFWAKVDQTGSCWLWTGAITDQGYGNFWAAGKNVYAHRFAWELVRGETPQGHLDHQTTCPKNCVNPDHLRVTSHKQNLENRAGAQSNSKSGVRGVVWHKRAKKWEARITHNRKTIHAGLFPTIAEAEAAVIAKRNELFTHSDVDRLVVA